MSKEGLTIIFENAGDSLPLALVSHFPVLRPIWSVKVGLLAGFGIHCDLPNKESRLVKFLLIKFFDARIVAEGVNIGIFALIGIIELFKLLQGLLDGLRGLNLVG